MFPQVLINVRVSQMGKARVSGTEPLVRVMLEGRDEDKIQVLAEEIAQVVKERLI